MKCTILLSAAVFTMSTVMVSATFAQSSGDESSDLHERMLKNPTMDDFKKIPRAKQLALIVEAEAGKMESNQILNAGTYAHMASELYPQAVKTLTPDERWYVDSKVLAQVWLQPEINEDRVAAVAERVFGKNGNAAPTEKIEKIACKLALEAVNTTALLAVGMQMHGDATYMDMGGIVTKAGQTALRRLETMVNPASLGAAQHTVCPTGKDDLAGLENKSILELRNIAADYLILSPGAKSQAAPSPLAASTSATNPAAYPTQGKCTLTQIHDSLVDGERSLREAQRNSKKAMHLSNRFSFNQGACRFIGKLERDEKTGSLKLELRPYAPGDASTDQEGKDLSTLVKNIYEWQQAPTAAIPVASQSTSTRPIERLAPTRR